MNNGGDTAEIMAKRNGHKEVLELIANKESLIAARQEELSRINAEKASEDAIRDSNEREIEAQIIAEVEREKQRKIFAATPIGKLQTLVNELGAVLAVIDKAKATSDQMLKVKKMLGLIEEVELQKTAEPDLTKHDSLDFNKINYQGFTPLHLVARFGYKEDARKMLDKRVNINAFSEVGISVLACATAAENIDIVKSFLEHPGIEFSVIEDALKVAIMFNNEGAVELISKSEKAVKGLAAMDKELREALIKTWKESIDKNAKGKNPDIVKKIRKSIANLVEEAAKIASTAKKKIKKQKGGEMKYNPKNEEGDEFPSYNSLSKSSGDIPTIDEKELSKDFMLNFSDKMLLVEENSSNQLAAAHNGFAETLNTEILTKENHEVFVDGDVLMPPAPPKHEPKTFTFNVKAAEFVPQKLLEVQPQPRYVPKPPRRKDVYIETVQLPSGQLVQLKDTIRNYDHEKYLE